jgi:hypothetical protein
MDTDTKTIVLHDVHGFGDQFLLLDGVDQDGNVWLYRRQKGELTCSICGVAVTDGWVCFQSGDAACTGHVTITGRVQ